jgi:hypothetical protein
MSWLDRESRLKDMLADSVVKAVMEADRVDPRKLESELRRTAALLRAMRPTSIPPASERSDLRRKREIT